MPSAHARADSIAHRRRLSRLRRGLDCADDISEYNRIAAEIRRLHAALLRVV